MELQEDSTHGKREREAKSRRTDAGLSSPPFFAGGAQMVEELSQEADGDWELLECDGTGEGDLEEEEDLCKEEEPYEQGELKPKQFPGEHPHEDNFVHEVCQDVATPK